MVVTLILFFLISLSVNSETISRDDFPDGFIFGTASSAFQVLYTVTVLFLDSEE